MLDKKSHRQLGSSDIFVSPVGLGTVKFGRNTDVKYPQAFDIPDDNSLSTLLSLSIELGINLIDTAPAYGNSESRLGKLLGGIRNHFYLSTKVGEYYNDGISHFDYSASSTRTSVEASLTRLRTDVLDLVFVHSDGNDEQIIRQTDVLDELTRLKDQGSIRTIGFSGKSVEGSLLAMNSIDVYMVALNETDQSQIALLDAARKNGKGILIKKALGSGNLADTTQALNFAVNFPGVTSVIVGTINPAHLKQNIDSLELRY